MVDYFSAVIVVTTAAGLAVGIYALGEAIVANRNQRRDQRRVRAAAHAERLRARMLELAQDSQFTNPYDYGYDHGTAMKRARKLLLDHLNPYQRQEYLARHYFTVVGGVTGRTYQIDYGYSGNVHGTDKWGKSTSWCGYPKMPDGFLPDEDVMLAQKLMLESTEEVTFLKTAGRGY